MPPKSWACVRILSDFCGSAHRRSPFRQCLNVCCLLTKPRLPISPPTCLCFCGQASEVLKHPRPQTVPVSLESLLGMQTPRHNPRPAHLGSTDLFGRGNEGRSRGAAGAGTATSSFQPHRRPGCYFHTVWQECCLPLSPKWDVTENQANRVILFENLSFYFSPKPYVLEERDCSLRNSI